ncbi:MAG: protein kinase [Victivallaceae bacterium]|nr:protein kinase [Victivallaceae bacterium]
MQMIGENVVFHGIKLLRYCGGGAYGDVYYGEDISGRRLAVKIIPKSKIGAAWQRELKGVANYRKITENAPELLKLFHVEADDDTFFYTMEAADSGDADVYRPVTLEEKLQNGPLPTDDLFPVVRAIFRGIELLHRAGFCHRDIKPANILFIGGMPKIGDIGLTASNATLLTQIAGTLDFLPPEIRDSEDDDRTDGTSCRKNDFYAFGKVVYCAATGNPPGLWPSMPPISELTHPQKLLLQLALQLCDRDSIRRIDDAKKIARELAGIEKNLIRGETRAQRLRFLFRRFAATLYSCSIRTLRWFTKHWLASILFFAALAGTVRVIRSTVTEIPVPEKGRLYHSRIGKFTIRIPDEWLDAQSLQEKLRENPDDETVKNLLTAIQRDTHEELLFHENHLKNNQRDWHDMRFDLLAIASLTDSDGKTYETLFQENEKKLTFPTDSANHPYMWMRHPVDGVDGVFIMGQEPRKSGYLTSSFVFRRANR